MNSLIVTILKEGCPIICVNSCFPKVEFINERNMENTHVMKLQTYWVNSSAFFNSVQFPFHWMEFQQWLNKNGTEIEQKFNRIWTKIEQKLNRNWTEIEWKFRTDNERLVKGFRLVYNQDVWARHPELSFHCPSSISARSISFPFLFHFCSIFVQFLFKFYWIEIEWK